MTNTTARTSSICMLMKWVLLPKDATRTGDGKTKQARKLDKTARHKKN
jgi:hypothetical protein